MATNVEIISREMIKPSSPTPTHLKTLKLSFLDQLAPPIYVPLIFFYHHQQLISNPKEISPALKQSLSKILTIFYPLAGIVQQNSRVDCNDSGAEFTEARVAGARVSDVIQEANMEEIKKILLPVESLEKDENIVLKVRLNFFDCGGVAVAVCLWHKLADGTSLVAFINAWAAAARGETLLSDPTFNFASFFPPRSLSGLEFTQRIGITKEKIATKRFLFNNEKIAKLKERNGGSRVKNPTRVEAVSSHIWRSFIKSKVGSKTASFAAVHAVNLRPRKTPPFSDHMFGNCWRHTIALFSPEDDYPELAVKLRAAITSIDDDLIKRVENGEYMNDLKKSVDLYMKGGIEFLNFTSWCRFPMYEVDFGWGKPARVCTTTLPFKNLVILMSTPCGEGIEAWVNLLQDDMKIFEQHLIG